MAAIMRDTAGGNKIKPLRRWDFDRFHRGSHPVYRDLSLSVSISRFFSLSQACQNNWDNKERERERVLEYIVLGRMCYVYCYFTFHRFYDHAA